MKSKIEPEQPLSKPSDPDELRKCGLQGNWCYVHHCYPSTCKELGHGQYAKEEPSRRPRAYKSHPLGYKDSYSVGDVDELMDAQDAKIAMLREALINVLPYVPVVEELLKAKAALEVTE